MASADEIARSFEPGTLEYGDREVLTDRIHQSLAQAQPPQARPPGRVSERTNSRLEGGPVSDLPVTAGLSVGPGPGPNVNTVDRMPHVDKLRLVAKEARNPALRKLARDTLRAMVVKQ